MAASAIGMFIRYLAHRAEQREIEEAKHSGPVTARESSLTFVSARGGPNGPRRHASL